MEEEATQPSTQNVFDPRRIGHSGFNETDTSDVLCILHPGSTAAIAIVAETYYRAPHHVLQSHVSSLGGASQTDPSEQETFILDPNKSKTPPLDIALRLSSETKKPALGFTFGRNSQHSDIVFHIDTLRRISNVHFRIYVNDSGVLMIQDMSTNGTLVDDVHLKQRGMTRMLQHGSIIQILSPKAEDQIKFFVRIPPRDDHLALFEENFRDFMIRVKLAEQEDAALAAAAKGDVKTANTAVVQRRNENAALKAASSIKPANQSFHHGMKWNGGDKYNVVAHLGNGAFATVYKLATKRDGKFYAAKELDKRRFMKNGMLDKRVENEMQIMQTVKHPNIVQYVDFQDVQNHLYIIMEFVSCGDLQGFLQDNNVLAEGPGRVMSRQVLGALAYLHDNKITHRDIKPDNILLSSVDPFEVKLSDFGLSKVVSDNNTFLKTFCGTLLYCAPEVFPHYDNHKVTRNRKRRRNSRHSGQPHSYSHSVDTWSYAAVLWFSLCGEPPFEGVADQTGLAMFNKIMETELDITALKARKISEEAVDLLLKMLNTDPSQRPTERQCLSHPWLADGSIVSLEPEAQLGAIEEGDEGDVDGPDLSQLSIRDKVRRFEVSNEDEVGFRSEDFDDFMTLRRSKRARDELYDFREQVDIESSPEVSREAIHILKEPNSSNEPQPSPTTVGARLFGEIGQSALRNSNALDERTNVALALSRGDTSDTNGSECHDFGIVTLDGAQDLPLPDQRTSLPGVTGMSLLGTESLVRDLHMESPPSEDSPAAGEPSTPKTPSPATSQSNTKSPDTQDITPRPPPFNRQITIPLSTSFFNPQLPANTSINSTVKGNEHLLGDLIHNLTSAPSLPTTLDGSTDQPDDPDITQEGNADLYANYLNIQTPAVLMEQVAHAETVAGAHGSSDPTLNAQSPAMPTTGLPSFARPPPRLGKLISTADSFAPISLSLSSRITVWGRDLSATHVYPHSMDTRIPKRGILLWFHASGIDSRLKQEPDLEWWKLEGLHTVINTESKAGIWVNGVHLKRSSAEEGVFFGQVYTGDEITILPGKGEGGKTDRLVFKCEFFHGEAANRRPEGTKLEVQQGSK
ncbi:MAG: hypothetical protein M1820_008532 [Bogoriella megaspora]|nr:MAG: hypothetical protein M1820_008532 [Bogoriella megaspora]